MPPVTKPSKPPKPTANGPAKAPKGPAKGRKKAQPTETRPVVYPFLRAVTHINEQHWDTEFPFAYAQPLTVEEVKELLGWQEEPEKGVFGNVYLMTDEHGKHIRCLNNLTNRPFDEGHCRKLAQSMLKKQWEVNGEAFIVGRYGSILSGQHRGVALILAEQMRTGPQSATWETYWDGPLTLETVVTYGVSEEGRVTRTLDNVKPRSLGDVLFCDPTMFGSQNAVERKKLVQMVDHALRLVWHRTGLDKNAFAKYRTHSESLDFIDRHPHLIMAVKHIWEEKGGKEILNAHNFIGPGYASALLYLMGASATEPSAYTNAVREGTHSESVVDFENWAKACEFWSLVCAGAPQLNEMRKAINHTFNLETGSGGTQLERFGVLIKAWAAFLAKGKITFKDVRMDYVADGLGMLHLNETIGCGGIDLGEESKAPEETSGPGEPATTNGPATDSNEDTHEGEESEEEEVVAGYTAKAKEAAAAVEAHLQALNAGK